MAKPDKQFRPWLGRFQYPGKKEFWAGTVILPRETPVHEIEAALKAKFTDFWNGLLPDSYTHPPMIGMEAGAIFFVPDEE